MPLISMHQGGDAIIDADDATNDADYHALM
jgi:hypothetical protein